MIDTQKVASILDIVRACDSVMLATIDGAYPDVRHMSNAMNRNAQDLTLYLMTGRDMPKMDQLRQNRRCCLYYFNAANRHVVRLFGEIEFIDDANTRHRYWNDEYQEFGYAGPDDPDFVLMRISPKSYKFYAGDELNTGAL